jgi:hypothetical protein
MGAHEPRQTIWRIVAFHTVTDKAEKNNALDRAFNRPAEIMEHRRDCCDELWSE